MAIVTPDSKTYRFTSSPGRKYLLAGLIVALLSAMSLYLVGVRNSPMPTAEIPTPTMPNPNAFDVYNGAAGERISRNIEANKRLLAPSERAQTSLAQKAAIVTVSREDLAAFRRAFALPYRQPPVRTINDETPYYQKFRSAARMMTLESEVAAANGDIGAAMNAALDSIEFGKRIGTGAPLLGGLVSVSCQAMGRRSAGNVRERLTAPQAKAAARRLENLQKIGVSYTDVLTEEKYAVQATTLNLFREWAQGRSGIDRKKGDEEETQGQGHIALPLPRFSPFAVYFRLYGRQQSFENITGYMDAVIAQSKRRYAADHALVKEPRDVISSLMLPFVSPARFKFAENDAQNALLMVDLALRAYKGERGNYPPALDALVPAYLSRLPDDPYAQSGPLRYRRTPDGFLLYSVGPDGKDDNGKPIQNTDSKTNYEKRLAKEKSLGDIVAGVNQ